MKKSAANTGSTGSSRRFVLLLFAVVLAGAALLFGVFVYGVTQPPLVLRVEKQAEVAADGTVPVAVTLWTPLAQQTVWYAVQPAGAQVDLESLAWQEADDLRFTFSAAEGTYTIYTKSERSRDVGSHPYSISVDWVSAITLSKDTVYLAVGAQEQLEATLAQLGKPDTALTWSTADTQVATVDETGTLLGVRDGETTLTVTAKNGKQAACTVVVTALLQPAKVNDQKPRLTAGLYTQAQNDLLDAILLARVTDAGYATRAGVVAAARFLALEFPYRIPYFYENGRLSTNRVDGEGRYYHTGLYLHRSRYAAIGGRYAGPAVWGKSLYSVQTEESEPNGLNCSGFISWCLLNGGYDLGDLGAGETKAERDLSDLGERKKLTKAFMASNQPQPGDLIGIDGHIAMILALDEKNIYIAESWDEGSRKGLHVDVYERYNGLVNAGIYRYVLLMDRVYGTAGNLTQSWQ